MSSTKALTNDKRNNVIEIDSSISAKECVKSLLSGFCQSIFVKMIIFILSLYYGGLIWFFYSHATSWSQLVHLCHVSTTEFVSTFYYEYQEYLPIFIYTNNKNNIMNVKYYYYYS